MITLSGKASTLSQNSIGSTEHVCHEVANVCSEP